MVTRNPVFDLIDSSNANTNTHSFKIMRTSRNKNLSPGKLRILERLLWPQEEDLYKIAEGNVESLFANRLLTEFADIPTNWIQHQVTLEGGRPDLIVRLNYALVLVVECKRAGDIASAVGDPIALRKALNQGLGYAFIAGAPLVMATNGEQLVLIDRHRVVINAQSREEILYHGSQLLKKIRPVRLYYLSRNVIPPPEATESIKLLGKVFGGEIDDDFDVEKALENIRSEFLNEESAWEAFKNEVLGWMSLWQHFKRSSRLAEGKQNEIIHVDYSFVSYFEGSWYYDQLYADVVRLEHELTQDYPGIAIRVFVLKDQYQLVQEYEEFRALLRQQIIFGYRVGWLYDKEWLSAGIVNSHVDIVRNVYAKIYFEIDNVLTGEISETNKHVDTLRSQVLDVIYQFERVFEPIALNKNSLEELDEKLSYEADLSKQ